MSKSHSIDEKVIEEFFKQFDFPFSNYFQQVVPTLIEKNRVYQATKKDLETNPKFKDFFNTFRADSIPDFIHKIASEKARNVVNGNVLEKLQTSRILDPKIRAEEGLWEIQQKKMFSMQCLWRAEKIEIPEIKVSWDFQYWEQNIKECPFLEPITEDEVDLYISYILTDDYTFHFDPFSSLQDYVGFKDEYMNSDESGYMPEWYSFYDIRKGTGSLLILPNIRGEKEQVYLDEFNKHEKKIEKVTAALKPPQPKRLDYYQIMEFVMEFMEENEDELTNYYFKETSSYYEVYKKKQELGVDMDDYDYENPMDGEAREALSQLEYTPFKIPIAAYYDWKQGIVNALYKYETQQVADAMKLVFEDYNMRKEMGIPFENTEVYEGHIKSWEKNLNTWRDRILEGRELLGEPRDFDF